MAVRRNTLTLLVATLVLLFLVKTSAAAPTTTEPSSGSSESDETTEVAETPKKADESEPQKDTTENTPLEASLEHFLALVPSEKIRNMSAVAYLRSDAVRESFNFLKSREFLDAKDKLLQAAEVQEFVKFLNQSGVNVVRFVRKVSDLTGIPATLRIGEELDSDESEESEEEASNVVSKLVDKVLAELPQEQFFTIFFEKMESDTDFSGFVERLNGDDFEAILLKIQESKALEAFQKKMLDHNMNLEKIWSSMKIFFGWGNNF